MDTIKGFDEKLELKHPKREQEWNNWLNKEHLPEEAIAWLQQFAYYLAKKGGDSDKGALTATQLRKFFGAVKKMHIQTLSKITKRSEPIAEAKDGDLCEESSKDDKQNAKKTEPQPLALVDRDELIGLIPQLAYAVARDENKTKLKDFADWVKNRLQQIENIKQFNNFIKSLEAIVAYHKYYEEKNKSNYN